MQTGKFLTEFFRYPKQVGTVARSSKFLAKKMAGEINGSRHVVEFGPGTGVITKEILKNLPPDGKLTCFEVNPGFCKYLQRINDSRLEVVNDVAENCERYVDDMQCVVSGLPLNLFSKSKRDRIIELSSKGQAYIQFQYTPFLLNKMKRYFNDVKLKFTPLNLPPAFIYVCRK